MNKLIAILFGLTTLCAHAQDTTCVMITLDEILTFDFQTSKVLERTQNTDAVFLTVNEGELMCLHLYDSKKRMREVTITFIDGSVIIEDFDSKDEVLYSPVGPFMLEISQPQKKGLFRIK